LQVRATPSEVARPASRADVVPAPVTRQDQAIRVAEQRISRPQAARTLLPADALADHGGRSLEAAPCLYAEGTMRHMLPAYFNVLVECAHVVRAKIADLLGEANER
jgi:hypothetical protein